MLASAKLRPGTLDLLVLRVLAWGENHGDGIAQWVNDGSASRLIVAEGALYLSLHRVEDLGLVASEWGLSERNRRAKYDLAGRPPADSGCASAFRRGRVTSTHSIAALVFLTIAVGARARPRT